MRGLGLVVGDMAACGTSATAGASTRTSARTVLLSGPGCLRRGPQRRVRLEPRPGLGARNAASSGVSSKSIVGVLVLVLILALALAGSLVALARSRSLSVSAFPVDERPDRQMRRVRTQPFSAMTV